MRIHKRGPHPQEQEILDGRPEIDAPAALCIEAWNALHSCRPQGFSGAGAIPWTSVLEWARWNRLDRDNTEMLIQVLQRLDADRSEQIASASALRGG